MGFKLTPGTNYSSVVVNINDTTVSTKQKASFLTVSDPVNESISTSHSNTVRFDYVTLQDPWPPIKVELSKQYDPYRRIIPISV